MTSQTSFGSSMLFQSINDDLNASLATADELSRQFDSLMKEASSDDNSTTYESQNIPVIFKDERLSTSSFSTKDSSSSSNGSLSSKPFSQSSVGFQPVDSGMLSPNKNRSSSPVFPSSPLPSPKIQRAHSPLPRAGSESYLFAPNRHGSSSHYDRSQRSSSSLKERSPSPNPMIITIDQPSRSHSPPRYDRSPRSSTSYMERSPSPSPTAFDQSSRPAPFHSSSNLLSPYENTQMGRRSPRPDRSPSPLSFNHGVSNTLPRNFRQPDERQKSPGKWNETDLDVSYERKPHHTYDKTEWLRPSVPNSNWRESNLDGPPPPPSAKKESRPQSHPLNYSSLPRNARISVPPDTSSPPYSPYHPQPIISRISIPPATQSRQQKPIPLSVIMRLQNPQWGAMAPHYSRGPGAEGDMGPPRKPPMPREFFHHPVPQHQQHPPEQRQPAVYSDVLNPADIDAELERIDSVHHMSVIMETPSSSEAKKEGELDKNKAPRPLSPTRLQPVVAPEAQAQAIPDKEELLRIRAEIPRALKRRGSIDHSHPLKKTSHYQPNQYKNLISKLFRKVEHRPKVEQSSETSSSSEGEDNHTAPAAPPAPQTPPATAQELKGYHSILRPSREHRSPGRRARLSPLVLVLDGALVGELETVQRAVQEMQDPSQPNDEGITALHNAICGGHYNVVDFLVRVGANVSAPDSHGWTPLHCAASCNDRPLCEFLVRNGAAVMAITESDGATASQKCDPYAVGFEECENFLRGVEEAMGVENSGVLYALWTYPAQAADELSFKEGDMVTILQKPEASDWWWASLCGREGFVPNNYFGLFPKVRPKSLC
ncbi:relA-associated inhibitor [Sphaeramia orbicularis]|uniref:SH3 domain-containing protein n=1 Tax=Sphaeramia orbicularis TaxID=375764 RepID=A0A673BCA6_9TELE|nr:relA-associated inhibitor [Sphaeramia orbicularis]